jgi:hypothetical protein
MNNIIFGDGNCTVEQSSAFIPSYLSFFLQVAVLNQDMGLKGKCVELPIGGGQPKQAKEPAETWRNAPAGWFKLNLDKSFSKEQNRGSWGGCSA